VKKKHDLDMAVALELGVPQRVVSRVTKTFIEELSKALVSDGAVYVDHFGRFLTTKCLGVGNSLKRGTLKPGESAGINEVHTEYRTRVSFKRAPLLSRRQRDADRRIDMDKYAVDESTDQEALEKRAAKGCPKCGAEPEKHGKVLMCPTHGTEPFESNKEIG
jgi:hypothetical protein